MVPSGAVRAARRDSVKQEQREEAERLGLVGHELGEQSREPDRLGAEVGADELVALGRGVALVEHEVDDRQHRPQPARQLGVARHAVRDLGVADLLLRAHEALGHRRLGNEERPGDVRRLEPAEQPQRERDLRARGERRVTAGEDEAEPVVFHVAHRLGRLVAFVEQRGLGVAVMAGCLTAQAVDGAVAGGGGDPAARVRRQPGRRPPLARNQERLLDHLFGDVDVAEETDQGGDDPAGFLTEDPFELGCVDGRHASAQALGLVLERADLDRAHAGGRALGRPRERGVEVGQP